MIQNFLEQLENKIFILNDDSYEKASHLYTKIQIKKDNKISTNSIYVDIKQFLRIYIRSLEARQYGYDDLNISKIQNVISFCSSSEERINLCSFTYRLLKQAHFDTEASLFKELTEKFKFQHLWEKKNYTKAVIHLASYDNRPILLTILILFGLLNIIFLDAPIRQLEIFEVTKIDYNTNFVINHILNVVSYMASLDEKMEVQSFGTGGVLLIVLIKVLSVIFLGNFLLEKIKSKINIDK